MPLQSQVSFVINSKIAFEQGAAIAYNSLYRLRNVTFFSPTMFYQATSFVHPWQKVTDSELLEYQKIGQKVCHLCVLIGYLLPSNYDTLIHALLPADSHDTRFRSSDQGPHCCLRMWPWWISSTCVSCKPGNSRQRQFRSLRSHIPLYYLRM